MLRAATDRLGLCVCLTRGSASDSEQTHTDPSCMTERTQPQLKHQPPSAPHPTTRTPQSMPCRPCLCSVAELVSHLPNGALQMCGGYRPAMKVPPVLTIPLNVRVCSLEETRPLAQHAHILTACEADVYTGVCGRGGALVGSCLDQGR